MNNLTPLEDFLAGGRKASTLFGIGYDGPEKPSDISTVGYLGMWLAAFGFLAWVVFHGH